MPAQTKIPGLHNFSVRIPEQESLGTRLTLIVLRLQLLLPWIKLVSEAISEPPIYFLDSMTPFILCGYAKIDHSVPSNLDRLTSSALQQFNTHSANPHHCRSS